jgi:hypothetical protein
MLNKLFQHRFTVADAKVLSVPACLERIKKFGLEPPETISQFEDLFAQAKRDWSILRDQMNGLVGGVCPIAAAEGRQFEAQMIVLDDNTPLGELVTLLREEQSGNAIIKTVTAVTMQNAILECRDTAFNNLNPDEILFEPLSEPTNLEINGMSSDADINKMWLTSPWAEADWFAYFRCEAVLPSGFDVDAGFKLSDVTFRWARIERQIAMLSDGKPAINERSFALRFIPADPNFAQVIETRDPNAQAVGSAEQDFNISTGQLARLAARIISDSKLGKKLPQAHLSSLNIILKNETQESLTRLEEWISLLIHFVASRNAETGEPRIVSYSGLDPLKKVIDDIGRVSVKPPPIFIRLQQFQLQHLKDIAAFLINKLESNSFLFNDVAEEFQRELSHSAQSSLEKLRDKIIRSSSPSEKAVWTSVLTALQSELTSSFVLNQLERFSSKPLRSIGAVGSLPATICSTNADIKLEAAQQMLAELLPETVLADNYSPFLRFAFVLCRTVEKEAVAPVTNSGVAAPQSADDQQTGIYKEKVPPELAEKDLADSAAVPAPQADSNPSATSASLPTAATAYLLELGVDPSSSTQGSAASELRSDEWREAPRGLQNFSSASNMNRCFANAALQSVLAVPKVREALIREQDDFPELTQVCRHVWIQDSHSADHDIEGVMKVLAKYYREYIYGRPQSAHEFLLRLSELEITRSLFLNRNSLNYSLIGSY